MSDCNSTCPKIQDNEEDAPKSLMISVEKNSIVSKIKSGKHTFYTDETENWGGKNRYPDPWDYIIGGLGGCITTTIRQYADQHSIKLDRAVVHLEYEYDLSSSVSPYIINKKVELFGDLTQDEKERLLLISNSPAQKMLERGLDVRD